LPVLLHRCSPHSCVGIQNTELSRQLVFLYTQHANHSVHKKAQLQWQQQQQQVLLEVIWEERIALTQLRNKVPIGGMPYIYPPKLPLWRSTPPFNTLMSRLTPLTTPNPISRFATVYFLDRHTHTERPIGGTCDRSTPVGFTLNW